MGEVQLLCRAVIPAVQSINAGFEALHRGRGGTPLRSNAWLCTTGEWSVVHASYAGASTDPLSDGPHEVVASDGRILPVAEVAEVTSSVGDWLELLLLRPVGQIGWLAGERVVLRSAAEPVLGSGSQER
jgi:hypothetical protein